MTAAPDRTDAERRTTPARMRETTNACLRLARAADDAPLTAALYDLSENLQELVLAATAMRAATASGDAAAVRKSDRRLQRALADFGVEG